MEAVAQEDCSLYVLQDRMRTLRNLSLSFKLPPGEVMVFGYTPLRDAFVRQETIQDIDRVLRLDLGLTDDQEVSYIIRTHDIVNMEGYFTMTHRASVRRYQQTVTSNPVLAQLRLEVRWFVFRFSSVSVR